jgi:hypothetical protein
MAADYANATIEYGAGPTSITLLELVKQRLGIVDNSRDDELSMYLQIAGEACEAYCDNVLAEQPTTEQHAATFSPIALRYFPLVTLNAVTVDGEDKTADYETFESEGVDYVTSSRTSTTCDGGFKQMNIAYTAGYEPLPADLGAAISSAAISYETGTGATGEVKKEMVVGVGSIEYTTSNDTSSGSTGMLSSSVTGTLDKYRREYL